MQNKSAYLISLARPNFKGMFMGADLTVTNYHGHFCPDYIFIPLLMISIKVSMLYSEFVQTSSTYLTPAYVELGTAQSQLV